MLKYIFSVLLIAAVWTTVLLLKLPLWIAVVSTIVILAVLLTVVIYRVIKAKRAAKEIEKALQAQADQHARGARPDLQHDIEAMKGEFMRAVAALKTSKLGGKRPAEALYALPWYMIIGPPGSGKSTALRNSGLRFPYLSKSGGGVQGVGGTRNCQWWMTNDAVILDTAGRYTTEESDHDEWMAFLEMLKRNRAKAPVNGVLAAIAITDLLDVHAEQIVAQAREIRARIDEVMNKLEMVVPVYVLFTKCDLIPGFVETFGDLGNNERGQIWGFTFPISKKIRDPMGVFAEHFQELAGVTERRALRRMSEERSLEMRDKIFAFPQYFEPMRDALAMFTGELFAENIYNESPIMRGCYFTSGTQEGRPIDRIMNSMAEAFGVQPRMQMMHNPQHVEAKSYFLGQLFTKVLFPDRYVAGRSAARIKRARLVGHGIGAGLMATAGGMVVLPVMSFQNNRELLEETDDAVAKVNEHYQEKAETESVDPIRIERIEPLRRVERKLFEYEDDGPPIGSRWGMYQGEEIYPPVRDLYFTAVREELLVPIRDMEIRELKRFKLQYGQLSEPAPDDEHAAMKDRLRMYLLITAPVEGERPESEPGLNEDEQAWLTERVATLWEKPLEIAGDVASKGEMREVARAYVAILATEPDRLFERDDKLVADVRKILMRTNRTQALLAQILEDVDTPDLDLKLLTDTREAMSNDNRKVQGKYTRTAWEEYVRDRLYAPLDDMLGDEWVLGISEEDMKKDRDKQLAELRSLYFEQYIQEWMQFINAINVRQPGNYNDALTVLEDLTRGEPASFKRLCQNLAVHTTLPPPEEEETEEATSGVLDAVEGEATKALQKKGKAGRIAAEQARRRKMEREKKKKSQASLLKDEYDVQYAFEGLVGFGYAEPPPAPEDGPRPPPPSVPVDDYIETLKELRVAVKGKVQNDTEEDAKALAGAVKSAGNTVDSLINDTDTKGWSTTLDKWLRPPVRGLESVGRGQAGADLTKAWCDEVVRPWSKLAKRYPFDTKGKEVALADFAGYFQPETGTLWKFYNNLLVARIPRRHEGYTIETRGAKATNAINPKVADFLDRAQAVTTVMFPPGTDAVTFEFSVQVQGAAKNVGTVSRTIFTVDGQQIEYKNGPFEWKPMTWPGEDPKQGHISALGFGTKGEVGPHEGEWGLFRLLEAGTATGDATKDTFKFEWDIRDQSAGIITVLIKPNLDDTPIYGTRARGVEFMQVFRHPDLSPPRQIVIGGPTCGGG
ncbi:type VI secretion system membrane subunit TssM [Paraliomyxa miuraensis]|uniref:type VI secretion system membrane subunit TssM n=1 Tax=Paraliomyxa miuraensis TaxID=376150 RepID=UPI00225AFB8D|nr:type VI secretion system membrane subunit TssM [Paraliomyxa miuraensis]MCX4243010.1 type VI secretion system membrane subunit TssM [Paraliomyxa miuraensis]